MNQPFGLGFNLAQTMDFNRGEKSTRRKISGFRA
jgi:hypothetical protein